MPNLQEEQVNNEDQDVVHYKIVRARYTWPPYAKLLMRRWKKQGYGTVYLRVHPFKACVGAVECSYSDR